MRRIVEVFMSARSARKSGCSSPALERRLLCHQLPHHGVACALVVEELHFHPKVKFLERTPVEAQRQ
jgi:hypothetical protein